MLVARVFLCLGVKMFGPSVIGQVWCRVTSVTPHKEKWLWRLGAVCGGFVHVGAAFVNRGREEGW